LDSRGSTSRTKLEKGFPESHASFNNVFDFLRTAGYVAKASAEHRAPYTITEKGRRFLESL
jgi:predicted transcriptional regulator